MASSAYSSMKKITLKVEGRITDSVVKLYNGKSFTDILENGPSNVKSLKPGDNDITYNMDEHLLLVIEGRKDTDYLKV